MKPFPVSLFNLSYMYSYSFMTSNLLKGWVQQSINLHEIHFTGFYMDGILTTYIDEKSFFVMFITIQ